MFIDPVCFHENCGCRPHHDQRMPRLLLGVWQRLPSGACLGGFRVQTAGIADRQIGAKDPSQASRQDESRGREQEGATENTRECRRDIFLKGESASGSASSKSKS